MKLVKLTANKDSFKEIKFNPKGLSLILGKKTDTKQEGQKNTKTINGIGKTLASYLVGYCLGSNPNETFTKKLEGWIFKLEFKIGDNPYIAERRVDDQENLYLNGVKKSKYEFNNELRELLFPDSVGVNNLGLRPLYKRFVRTDKLAYNSYDSADEHEYSDTKLIRNAYLLGLNIDLITKKVELKKELDSVEKTKNNLNKDDLIKKFISEENSIKKSREELLWERERIANELNEYKIAENYSELESNSKNIYRELAEKKNEKYSINNDLKGIEETINMNPDLEHSSIKNMYEELGAKFSEELSKSIDDVTTFYETLRDRRKKRLFDRKKDLIKKLESLDEQINRLQTEYDEVIKYLDTHGALDEFHELKEYEKSILRDLDKLDSYKSLLQEVEKKINKLKENFITQDQLTNDYLVSHAKEIDDIKVQFVKYIKQIYPEKGCGLEIENNTGINKTRFDINAYIHSDSSDGINEVLILCYDLLILSLQSNHIIDFLYHDSRLYSDVDPRQRASMFKLANEISNNLDKQYIASVNEDQLETIKQYFDSDDEYKSIIEDNVVLVLKDDSPESKLLGIDVELKY